MFVLHSANIALQDVNAHMFVLYHEIIYTYINKTFLKRILKTKLIRFNTLFDWENPGEIDFDVLHSYVIRFQYSYQINNIIKCCQVRMKYKIAL